MSDYVSSVLDELVPRFEDERGEWRRVLADAGVATGSSPVTTDVARTLRPVPRRRRSPRLTRRRLAFVAVVVLAVTIPLVAAASQNWWFFKHSGSAPDPITDVAVVKSGVWEETSWQLVAYLSATDGICFSLTPTGAMSQAGEGAALGCSTIEGIPSTADSKPSVPHGITFLVGGSMGFPMYVVGPVIDTADEVAIHLHDGETVRTPTFAAPKELGSIRFYATTLPELEDAPGEIPQIAIQRLVGLTSEGQVVACLVPSMAEASTPLSACR